MADEIQGTHVVLLLIGFILLLGVSISNMTLLEQIHRLFIYSYCLLLSKKRAYKLVELRHFSLWARVGMSVVKD